MSDQPVDLIITPTYARIGMIMDAVPLAIPVSTYMTEGTIRQVEKWRRIGLERKSSAS